MSAIAELANQIADMELYADVSYLLAIILSFISIIVAILVAVKWRSELLGIGIALPLTFSVLYTGVSLSLNFDEKLEAYCKEYIEKLPVESYVLESFTVVNEINNLQEGTYTLEAAVQYIKDGMPYTYEGVVDIQNTKGDTVTFKNLDEPIGDYEAGLYEVTIK